jgi:hypothetical protein
MSNADFTNDVTLSRIQARLQRLERQNRVLITLLCAAAATASIAAARAAPTVLAADEIRAHHFSLLDPTGAVVSEWLSDSPGTWYDPPGPRPRK